MSKSLTDARKKDDRGLRLPAREVDAAIEHQLNLLLHDRPQLTDWIREFGYPSDLEVALGKANDHWQAFTRSDAYSRREFIAGIVRRVQLKPGELHIEVDRHAVVAAITTGDISNHPEGESTTFIRCAFSLRRRGVEMRMIIDSGSAPVRAADPNLIDLVLRAHRYLTKLTAHDDVKLSDVATSEAVDPSEVSRVLPLAFLSPKLVDQILNGTQSVSLTGQRLSRLTDLPMSWADQYRLVASL